ncbi:MAG: ABC transporter permease [Planctomycetota bacterium]
MSIFKIAWRSIQHRGFGSLLTIISMALGVMMVVAVLSIHGVVSQSFKNNNSFGYNVIVGARGGAMQLTMNTVYYLSAPVENIPYEYYLAFCDEETRQLELSHSIAAKALENELNTVAVPPPGFGGPGSFLLNGLTEHTLKATQEDVMEINKPGLYRPYTHIAIPICLGDYYEVPGSDLNFRCVGTKPQFFTELVLDIETQETFSFAEGRCFYEWNLEDPEIGPHECVVGATVARRGGVELGDTVFPTHGNPASLDSHIHETPFTVVGILDATGTPHDRVVFLNMEGFFLMDGHVNAVEDNSVLPTGDDAPSAVAPMFDPDSPIEDLETPTEEDIAARQDAEVERIRRELAESDQESGDEISIERLAALNQERLAIERREVTAVLVRTSLDDKAGVLGMFLPSQINQGDLQTTLDWSSYRPIKAQTASQAVNPVGEVTKLFSLFVDPVQWILLALTVLICIVSALSIVVGIYNSMNQRRHEIAVMRALGASRSKVMSIMFVESIMLACLGGFLGWIAGHGLNAALGPVIEDRTGVPMSFFDFAPAIPLTQYLGELSEFVPEAILAMQVSPELLLIPGLMILAVIVGVYPAFSAYKTDVAGSLGK